MRQARPGPQAPPGWTLGTMHSRVTVSHSDPCSHGAEWPLGVHDAPTAARAAQVPPTHGSDCAHSPSEAHAPPTVAMAVHRCDVEEQNASEAHRTPDGQGAPAAA